MCFLYMTTFTIIYVGYMQPFSEKSLNMLEVLNEITILAVGYHLITFTPFAQSPDAQYSMGFTCAGFVLLNVTANMVMLIREKLTGICLKVKYRAILQKKKVVKKRKDKMDKKRRKQTFSIKLRKIKT